MKPGSEIPPVSRETIRSWDHRALLEYGIPGIILMENAARGAADLLCLLRASAPARFGPPYQVMCGTGNNGGDGMALARHLENRSLPVTVHLAEPRSQIRPETDAGINLRILERMGVDLREPGPDRPLERAIREATGSGVLIDALLGTGLTRSLGSPYREWVEAMNASSRPIVAIDLPTGLDADSGEVLGAAVRAEHTFTMAAPKLGFTRGAGPALVGWVHLVEISLPRRMVEGA